jgi:hypothetical protein
MRSEDSYHYVFITDRSGTVNEQDHRSERTVAFRSPTLRMAVLLPVIPVATTRRGLGPAASQAPRPSLFPSSS